MFARHLFIVVVALFLFSTLGLSNPAGQRTTTSSTKTTSSVKTTSTTTKATSSTKTTSSAKSTSTVYNTFTYNANFDDLTNSNLVVPTQNINIYKSLYWQAFNLDTVVVNPPPSGVIPNSGNQVAVFSSLISATEGQSMMSVDYQTSTILFFHLSSFYYGCALGSKEGVISAAVACTISLIATDVNGNQLATQSFAYNPTGVVAQMSYAQLSAAFQQQQVYQISFTLTSGTTGTVVGLVDTVLYTVYGSGAISGNS